MRRTPNRPSPRAGFTLVELRVVMTIIAILFALTAAAVVKSIQKADEVKTRNDISQLAAAVQAFKTDFGVPYLPSRIVLPPGFDGTGESTQFISSMWPRINAAALGTTPAAFLFWNMPANPATPVILSGDQCLVFFLGGWRDLTSPTFNCFGFSTSPTTPLTGPAVGEVRKGPYFEFPPTRLQLLNHSGANDTFPSFIDPYGSLPYVYFSSRKAANDYPTVPGASGPTVAGTSIVTPAGTSTVYPYQLSGTPPNQPALANQPIRVWANKSGFQIISGGRDTLFHNPATPSNPPTVYAGGLNWIVAGGIDQGGYDNMSNFHPTLLGVPAN